MTVKKTKTDAFIRDVAQLFVTYPSSVWKPALEELAEGSVMHKRISAALAAILSEIPSGKKLRPQPKKRKTPPRKSPGRPATKSGLIEQEPEFEFSSGRATDLTALRDDLAARAVLPTLSDLRQIYLEVGGKDDFPRDRKKASQILLAHLNTISDDAFLAAVNAIKESSDGSDAADAYGRWFKLIRPQDSGLPSIHRAHATHAPVEEKVEEKGQYHEEK